MKDYTLLTGATGQVGQYLLRDLLSAGQKLVVLVRDKDGVTPEQRIEKILDEWDEELIENGDEPLRRQIIATQGDITQGNCGVSSEALRWIRDNCHAVIHNAASLKFVGSDRSKEPWLSNVTGTENVIELCRHANISEMHYVSTAYVCGNRADRVFEPETENKVGFRNDYEECKFTAESMIRNAGFRSLTVYRPGTIVGDSKTGRTAAYNGVYPYMQFVHILTQGATPGNKAELPIRLDLSGDERRNLVPIDWVSSVITHIVTQAQHHGQTYHLTPPNPITVREIESGMRQRLHYVGPTFNLPNGVDPATFNDVEREFYSAVKLYQPYWNEEPTFDVSNTLAAVPIPCPTVDADYMGRLIDFAIEDRWGRKKKARKHGRHASRVGARTF